MENEDYTLKLPFGAKDSGAFEYTIPEGYIAEIKDGKVIVKKAENEDKKIRKAIVNLVGTEFGDRFPFDGFTREQTLAWLEKQGEQKPTEYTLEQAAGIFLDALSNTPYNNKPITDAQVITKELLKFLENTSSYNPNAINEQKPVDKVVKAGDWVVTSYGKVNQVVSVDKDGDGYILDDGVYFSGSWCNMYHLWTIQDAKDGDVLCCESGWTCIFKALHSAISFSSYCFMDNTGWFCGTGSDSHTLEKAFIKAYNGNIYPASKEQRDLLFQKMYGAGYVWDSEKKKLNKIEKKPAWSEEDEELMKWSIINLTELKDRFGEEYGKVGYCINWLKSISSRLNWKPSDEQIEVLQKSIKAYNEVSFPTEVRILSSLCNELKKL